MPSRSSPTDTRPLRHSLRYVGGAATCALVNNLVLITADAFGCMLIVGILLSWLSGGTTGFLWHSVVTYQTKPTLSAFGRFMAGALAGIPLAWAALWLFHESWRWPMWAAGPSATAALFIYHYINALIAVRWHWLRSCLVRT